MSSDMRDAAFRLWGSLRLVVRLTFCTFCAIASVSYSRMAPESAPNDAAAQLAKEVRGKGWIVYTGPGEKGDWDLFLMRPDGSNQRNITRSPDFHEIGARFSPDGKKMLYRRIPRNIKASLDNCGTQGELVIANSDGSAPSVVGKTGQFPWASWSPDGIQIACLSKSGIEIYDLATKKLLRQTDRKGIYQQLIWSPDGKSFCGPANFYGESWTVVRMDVATGAVNPVSKYQNCTPDWFPDSKHLIFSYRPANQEVQDGGNLAQAVGQKPEYGWTQLWMADAEGRSRSLVYGEDGRHIYCGEISPDGKYVVFAKSKPDLGAVNNSVTMALIRLQDAPIIGGESKALRRLHPQAKDGPILPLVPGCCAHWTFAAIGREQK
jgi:Tol biopolymer transport system component